ncbi:hypothetical protein PoB_001213500 [Plakobranchus ocellatus]|uniref:Uncharacterized protein n=1 Tax=Plakobranchus ocellatus TaxID=259542 RepID=A0AAV3YT90_9GAST|nr:hypothetical protein PoB_001213500 [Plakobranchus ocellatus]
MGMLVLLWFRWEILIHQIRNTLDLLWFRWKILIYPDKNHPEPSMAQLYQREVINLKSRISTRYRLGPLQTHGYDLEIFRHPSPNKQPTFASVAKEGNRDEIMLGQWQPTPKNMTARAHTHTQEKQDLPNPDLLEHVQEQHLPVGLCFNLQWRTGETML